MFRTQKILTKITNIYGEENCKSGAPQRAKIKYIGNLPKRDKKILQLEKPKSWVQRRWAMKTIFAFLKRIVPTNRRPEIMYTKPVRFQTWILSIQEGCRIAEIPSFPSVSSTLTASYSKVFMLGLFLMGILIQKEKLPEGKQQRTSCKVIQII